MLDSLLFWEVVTFAVLMTVFFLFIYPGMRRRKTRTREMMRGSEQRTSAEERLDRRYAEGEILR